jgi:H+/Cl- antiporter ClcA
MVFAFNRLPMQKFGKILLISLFVGMVSGGLSSLFLHSLLATTSLRNAYPLLIWGLPLFGLVFGLLLKKLPHHINQGVPHLLKNIETKSEISPWMAPFIFLSSLGTHLFGGSAGREGVGVIMGASAAHLMPKIHEAFKEMKPYLLYSGMAAGFSSIFGTPLAAIVFCFELHFFKEHRNIEIMISTTLASFIAFFTTHFLGTVHQDFTVNSPLGPHLIFYVLIATMASGLGAHLYYWGLEAYSRLISKIFKRHEVKLMVGGLLISLIVYFTKSYDYVGIGSDIITRSFHQEMSVYDFTMKTLLTIMTLALGLKGGEVTPLFFMGATFSNSLCALTGLKNFALSSALGMVGLFGAATGAPIASAVMGAELFGPEVGVLCLITSLGARKLMGRRSVYVTSP